MKDRDLVDVEEAASILGVDRGSVLNWCRPKTGHCGEQQTYMPTPAVVEGDAPQWNREDLVGLAARRDARSTDLTRRAAAVRRDMWTKPAGEALAWIEWHGKTVGVLAASAEDGSGTWSVQPMGPAEGSNLATPVPVGESFSVAAIRGLDVVAKRVAQDLIRGIDPFGPGGYSGPSIVDDLHPEVAERDAEQERRHEHRLRSKHR